MAGELTERPCASKDLKLLKRKKTKDMSFDDAEAAQDHGICLSTCVKQVDHYRSLQPSLQIDHNLSERLRQKCSRRSSMLRNLHFYV